MLGLRIVELTFAFVGILGGGPSPGPVEMKRFASLAVSARGVVFAVAGQLTRGVLDALGSVAVALAPSADGEVRDGVLVGHGRGCRGHNARYDVGRIHGHVGDGFLQLLFRSQHHLLLHLFFGFLRLFRRRELEPMEDHFDVRGGHPVLKDRRVVEVSGAGPSFQSAERYPRSHGRVADEAVRVGTQGFLFVGFGDRGAVRSPVEFPALSGVELERLPSLAVVHALENCY